MYSGESANSYSCTLGVCGNILLEDILVPTASKIGGRPAWYSGGPSTKIQCDLCGESMVMKSCSLKSNGWKVLRDQELQPNALPELPKSTITMSHSIDQAASSHSWAFDSVSDVGTSSLGDDLDMSDLESLLEARNSALTTSGSTVIASSVVPVRKTKKKRIAPATAVDSTDFSSSICRCFPVSYKVLEIPELEPLGAVDAEDSEIYSGCVSNEKVRLMLEVYLKDEEEKDIVDYLSRSREGRGEGGETDHFFDMLKPEEDEPDEPVSSHASKKSAVGGNGNIGADSLEQRLSRLDKNSLVEAHFLRSVSLEPRQVLRYAYEGMPLWCSYPPPITDDSSSSGSRSNRVPACECCGAARVFELQLMPALLSLPGLSLSSCGDQQQQGQERWAAVEHPLGQKSAPHDLNSLLGEDGIEFGVVAVWSCPASCAAEEGGGEPVREFVLVQPPPDLLAMMP